MSIESKNTHFEDFVGFTFDGTHSSDLNLYRVNDGGNRYTWDMVPAFQDKTVQVGGRDGTYYFGSNYQKRDIQISVAFDNVGEEEFNKIRTWGADKKIHKLIFDETPYKYYNVKLSKSPQLKYICFDESENFMRDDEPIERKSRIYKGEGTFNFVCYEPFARGTIISKEEIYEAEPETIKIFLNKDYDGIVELPIDALEEIDNDEVQIYLSTDINNRGEWGLPTLDETGKPAHGQWDPYAEKASSNYYAYQPQKVILKQDLFGTNIELVSDYQTYLYPIDLKHGFVGQIDTYSGITMVN